MKLDPKGRKAARLWAIEAASDGGVPGDDYIDGILTAYISTITPAEVGGLWAPANPEHAKLGWTYDFDQIERIGIAAHKSTGYDATMEVVEFVMSEADRRHRTALEAQAAELAAKNTEIANLRKASIRSGSAISAERAAHAETKRERDKWERHATTGDQVLARTRDKLALAEAQRDEALKALEPFAELAGEVWADEFGWTDAACQNDRICDWFGPSAFFAARRVREGGKADG